MSSPTSPPHFYTYPFYPPSYLPSFPCSNLPRRQWYLQLQPLLPSLLPPILFFPIPILQIKTLPSYLVFILLGGLEHLPHHACHPSPITCIAATCLPPFCALPLWNIFWVLVGMTRLLLFGGVCCLFLRFWDRHHYKMPLLACLYLYTLYPPFPYISIVYIYHIILLCDINSIHYYYYAFILIISYIIIMYSFILCLACAFACSLR